MDKNRLASIVAGAVDVSAQSQKEKTQKAVVVMVVEEGKIFMHRVGSGGERPNWQSLDVLLGGLTEEDTAEAIERMIDSLWHECPRGTRVQLVSAGHALASTGMLADLLDVPRTAPPASQEARSEGGGTPGGGEAAAPVLAQSGGEVNQPGVGSPSGSGPSDSPPPAKS